MLMAMNDGVLYVFQAHDWSKAFDENGFGHNQRYLCQSVVRAARFELPLSIPASLPTLMQMRSIWPTGTIFLWTLCSHPSSLLRQTSRPRTQQHVRHIMQRNM